MNVRKLIFLCSLLFVTTLVLGFLVLPSRNSIAYAQDDARIDKSLTSIMVTKAPTLDGVADEAFWADAVKAEIPVRRGANHGETIVNVQSVYTKDMVYFLIQWEDPTESNIRAPWEMQADGTWKQLSDPKDKGGDNNVWYEDKLALIWPIDNSIPDFAKNGCFTACHKSDPGDPKPYGNKFTSADGELGDIWHWKSVRNLNQVDDQWLDNTGYSKDTPEAGRHSDAADSGGYKNNITEDKKGPAFMLPGTDFARDGAPGYILESEAVPFDASQFKPGDRVPAIIKSEIVGDRGDISAGWKWADGMWTLEFGRKLETGSEHDVQFNDLSATYYFGVAVFDNAQVRHAFQRGGIAFNFAK
jgi:hypothetical protein